jgi:hypothetical protein
VRIDYGAEGELEVVIFGMVFSWVLGGLDLMEVVYDSGIRIIPAK